MGRRRSDGWRCRGQRRRRWKGISRRFQEMGSWQGYSYAWDEGQSDATLVDAGGRERMVVVADAKSPGGKREQVWHYASRAQCATCHNPWAGFVLGFTLLNLDRNGGIGGSSENQLGALRRMGLVA